MPPSKRRGSARKCTRSVSIESDAPAAKAPRVEMTLFEELTGYAVPWTAAQWTRVQDAGNTCANVERKALWFGLCTNSVRNESLFLTALKLWVSPSPDSLSSEEYFHACITRSKQMTIKLSWSNGHSCFIGSSVSLACVHRRNVFHPSDRNWALNPLEPRAVPATSGALTMALSAIGAHHVYIVSGRPCGR
jgi:hypothetical protein